MNRVRTLTVLVMFAVFGSARAEEIVLATGEIENLGIRFVSPAPAADVVGIEATARVVLAPAGDAVIGAAQTGLLARVAANVGDEVVEGQVLAELKSPDFISLQREFLDALNAQRLVQTEHERDKQLHAEGIISARRLQETAMRKAIADAALDEHRQLLNFAGVRTEDIRSLESEQRLQAALLVRAPFSGVIAERMASTGERLDAMSPIYRLVDMSQLWLDINVPQERLAFIRPGARVQATGSDGPCLASVASIGRTIDAASQSAIVRARLDEGATGCRPGQLIAVRVVADDPESRGTGIHEVPVAAITRSGDASYVFVRTTDGVEVTQVDVLGVSGSSAFVSGAVTTDDLIAAAGVSALKSLWAARSEEET